MVRSLWSGATGMMAQQNNVDTIAHNLANVNTTGYMTEVAEFKSLLYQTIRTRSTTANGINKPIGSQIGLGVRNSSITSEFSQGAFLDSENPLACAIGGNGFFGVRGEDEETYYTRNGNFVFALNDGGGLVLTNSDGLEILNTNGQPITFAGNYIANRFQIGQDGQIYYPDGDGNLQTTGVTLGLWQFQNPKGLDKVGDTMYHATNASGEALNENTNANVQKSTIRQGYLEGANVSIATEMVNMIIAQRAYESNSKSITTSDQMLQTANQLKS